MFGERIKGNIFMTFPKLFILVFCKSREHRTIIHIVTVDNNVVAWLFRITVFLNIRATVIRVLLIKTVFQIEIRIVLWLHNRVIDFGVLNLYPSDHIIVFKVKFLILRYKGFITWIIHNFTCVIGRFIYDFSQAIINLRLFVRVVVVLN